MREYRCNGSWVHLERVHQIVHLGQLCRARGLPARNTPAQQRLLVCLLVQDRQTEGHRAVITRRSGGGMRRWRVKINERPIWRALKLRPRSSRCPVRHSVRLAPSCLGVRFATVAISFPTTLIRLATVAPNIDPMTEVHTGQRDAKGTRRAHRAAPNMGVHHGRRIHRDQSGAKKNAYL